MLTSEPKPLLVFSLSNIEYGLSHIPGSVCIPFEIQKDSPDMPEDLKTPIVFYCKGPG
jgi:rhodanese-related sulfurtransferase